MNKRSTKVTCFTISMDCYVCPVQILIERFSRTLIKYGFNICFCIVDMTSFGPQLGFPNIICFISFSFINGCLIENALYSDVICLRIVIGGDPPNGSRAVSACYKILFFFSFSFLKHGKRETNEPLAS